MTATVPTPLNLGDLRLAPGSHADRDQGVCLMEAVAWFAGERHSDAPACVSPYLRQFGIALNDRADDARRQLLVRFVPLVVGTAGDGLDDARRWIGADHAIRVSAPRWLDRAGLADHAAALRALPPITDEAACKSSRVAARAAQKAAYVRRDQALAPLRATVAAAVAKVLKDKPVAVAAAADAAADAAAAVAADAADAVAVAADAAADAAAAVAADAAVAAAAAAAVAVAAAAAVAAAVAAAAAAAAAAAVADAVAADGFRWRVYDTVYDAVKARLKMSLADRYSAMVDEGWDDAIELYARLITAA
jgi:NADH dehydrogenase/NADH:ubiquinone oxidoreductase subunit G